MSEEVKEVTVAAVWSAINFFVAAEVDKNMTIMRWDLKSGDLELQDSDRSDEREQQMDDESDKRFMELRRLLHTSGLKME